MLFADVHHEAATCCWKYPQMQSFVSLARSWELLYEATNERRVATKQSAKGQAAFLRLRRPIVHLGSCFKNLVMYGN